MEFLGSGVDGRNRFAGGFGQISWLSSPTIGPLTLQDSPSMRTSLFGSCVPKPAMSRCSKILTRSSCRRGAKLGESLIWRPRHLSGRRPPFTSAGSVLPPLRNVGGDGQTSSAPLRKTVFQSSSFKSPRSQKGDRLIRENAIGTPAIGNDLLRGV